MFVCKEIILDLLVVLSDSKVVNLDLLEVLSVSKVVNLDLLSVLSVCRVDILELIVLKSETKPLTELLFIDPSTKFTLPEQFKLTVSILELVIVVLNPLYKAFNEKDGRLIQELIYIC